MSGLKLVKMSSGKVVTNSLLVAQEFGKRHADVMRAIRTCLIEAPETRRCNFALTSQPTVMPNGGLRDDSQYELTRDGFMFVVMGFSGKKADRIKWEFLEQFNAMEETLLKFGHIKAPTTIEDWIEIGRQFEARAIAAEKIAMNQQTHAVDNALAHALTAAQILARYPTEAAAFVAIGKAKIPAKNHSTYQDAGFLSVGLKSSGVVTTVNRDGKNGQKVKLYNLASVEQVLGVSQVEK